MPSRLFSRLFGSPAAMTPVAAPLPAATPPSVPRAPAVPSAARSALIADALRIRAEMRERIGVEKLRVLHRLLTGKDPA